MKRCEMEKIYGYVKNCYLGPRIGETMFTTDNNANPIPTLDGYVIIPKEQFLDDEIIKNIRDNIQKDNQ